MIGSIVTTLCLLVSCNSVVHDHDLSRIAVVGDSMSTGYGGDNGRGYIDILQDDGVNIQRWAENGASNVRWLYQYPEKLESIEQYEPTTTIVMLGGNSYIIGRGVGDWYSYTTQLVDRIKGFVPDTEIVLVSYYDICAYGVDCDQLSASCDVEGFCGNKPIQKPSWEDYKGIMSKFSSDNGIRYIELPDIDPDMISGDMAHMNREGQEWFAEELMSRLE